MFTFCIFLRQYLCSILFVFRYDPVNDFLVTVGRVDESDGLSAAGRIYEFELDAGDCEIDNGIQSFVVTQPGGGDGNLCVDDGFGGIGGIEFGGITGTGGKVLGSNFVR